MSFNKEDRFLITICAVATVSLLIIIGLRVVWPHFSNTIWRQKSFVVIQQPDGTRKAANLNSFVACINNNKNLKATLKENSTSTSLITIESFSGSVFNISLSEMNSELAHKALGIKGGGQVYKISSISNTPPTPSSSDASPEFRPSFTSSDTDISDVVLTLIKNSCPNDNTLYNADETTPTAATTSNCKNYTTPDGKSSGTACRQENGTWEIKTGTVNVPSNTLPETIPAVE